LEPKKLGLGHPVYFEWASVCGGTKLTQFMGFVDKKKATQYSLFVAAGGGFGGVELGGQEGAELVKAIAYPGKWTHQLKAIGCPNAFPPRKANQSRFAGQWGQIQALLGGLGKLEDPEVAGLRVEMRRKPSASSWPDVENDVKHYFEEVSKRLAIKQIAPQAILEDARVALGHAESAGLFQCQGHARHEAPIWEIDNWARPVHQFGVSNKYTHRHAFQQALKDAPWGKEDKEAEDSPSVLWWAVNPEPPRGSPSIYIREDMTSKEVQAGPGK
jgi:hypothetical protein